jgi:glutamate-1-semialdehyde 2,1-aminomutase
MHANARGIPLTTNEVGGMFGFFFSEEDRISNFAQASRCDTERFKKFFHAMLAHGVYLAPSAFEAGFVSITHSDDDIADTLEAAERAFDQL